MKILTFTFVAVIATTIIGFRLFGINPTYKAARLTSTITQGADTNNTPHQEEDLKLHQDIRILPDGAAPALNDDHRQQQYHSTMNRKLDSSCDDSPLKVLTGKARKSAKTCKIIGSNPKRFCKGRIIKSHCPDACGVCESFGTADSEATFLFDGGKTDCAWLHDLVTPSTLLQISMLCKVDAIRETCRYTCGFFFHSCAMCSNEPTSPPSLENNMPSSLPSTSSSSFPSTSPSMSPSTSPTTSSSLSNPPSPSPTTQCLGKITSIINEHFGDVTKGPPQEEAYEWLIKDITDDECDDEAMIIQRYILTVLYFSAGGDDWNIGEGWLNSTTECDWEGLDCDDNQQVTSLKLDNNNLNGTIPAELSTLTNIERLALYRNNLSGTIPGSIFELPKLEGLRLDENDLTGTIPDNFGGSNSVRVIILFANLLTGTIPEITGDSLQNTEVIYLDQNNLSGSIPGSIFQLPKLKDLDLSRQDLTGKIPDNFGASTSLKYIYLYDNLLTGTIPEISGDSLQSIVQLILNENKMSGPVPEGICDLRSSKPNQFTDLEADCAPPDSAQNPCPSGCCTECWVGKGLP